MGVAAEISDDSTVARPVIRDRWLLIDPEKHVYTLDVFDGLRPDEVLIYRCPRNSPPSSSTSDQSHQLVSITGQSLLL
jgi:hypothetical protein